MEILDLENYEKEIEESDEERESIIIYWKVFIQF